MNDHRCNQLDQIKERLAVILGQIGDLQGEIEAAELEEDGEYENLSEELQTTAQGQRIEEITSDLRQARRIMEGAARDLSRALDSLETAVAEREV